MSGFYKAILAGLETYIAKLAVGVTSWSRPSSAVSKLAAPQKASAKADWVSVAPRLTLADQWSKLDAVLVRSASGSLQAKSLQKAAAQKLDLAQYGLQTLMDDLATVMTVPGRRAPAPVLVLDVSQQRVPASRPAAHAA